MEEGRIKSAPKGLTKATLGASRRGLFKKVFLDYGGNRALSLVNSFQKLAHAFMEIRGFSVGVGDCFMNCDEEVARIKKSAAEDAVRNGVCLEISRKADAENAFRQMCEAGSRGRDRQHGANRRRFEVAAQHLRQAQRVPVRQQQLPQRPLPRRLLPPRWQRPRRSHLHRHPHGDGGVHESSDDARAQQHRAMPRWNRAQQEQGLARGPVFLRGRRSRSGANGLHAPQLPRVRGKGRQRRLGDLLLRILQAAVPNRLDRNALRSAKSKSPVWNAPQAVSSSRHRSHFRR